MLNCFISLQTFLKLSAYRFINYYERLELPSAELTSDRFGYYFWVLLLSSSSSTVSVLIRPLAFKYSDLNIPDEGKSGKALRKHERYEVLFSFLLKYTSLSLITDLHFSIHKKQSTYSIVINNLVSLKSKVFMFFFYISVKMLLYQMIEYNYDYQTL